MMNISSKKNRLLERLVSQRMSEKIDIVLREDKFYRNAVKRQDIAFNDMKRLKLSKKQKMIIDRAISANNHCGAMYGIVAYRLGLQDGIKLMSEINKIIK
ncbi:MAG: hypothetical protein HFH88_14690 [Lachnospiraceae bacterium]|nr:hypothetical protein [Lachnospiraceae bacterium]